MSDPITTTSLAESIQTLQSIADKLNQQSDALNLLISVLDDKLQSLNLGVSAWHPISSPDKDGVTFARYLGYAKVGKRWGLSFKESHKSESGYIEEKWLYSDAPRWMRADCVQHIPALFKDLVLRSNEVLYRTMESMTFFEEITGALESIQ